MRGKRKKRIYILIAGIILCIALVFCVYDNISRRSSVSTSEKLEGNDSASENNPDNQEGNNSTDDKKNEADINSNKQTGDDTEKPSTGDNNSNSEVESVGNDNTDKDDTTDMNDTTGQDNESADTYDFTKPVPESDAVDDDYFSDAVFIGNSQIEGIAIYSAMKDATVYAGKGIMVDTIYTKEIIRTKNSDRITIMNALSKKQFKKVYILLGANELGWAYDSVFIRDYEKVIDDIKNLQPNAIIYVSSIIAVSKTKDSSDSIYNNTNITKYNKLIADMCSSKQLYYIDSYEALADENGYLPEDAGPDGIHLNRENYAKWFEYFKTHTIKTIKDEKN